MFDIGFSEMLLLAAIALIAIGPKQLPEVARTVGRLINDESLFKNAKLTLQKLDKTTEGLEDQGPLSILGMAVGTLF